MKASIIIPTYGRSIDVLGRTITSLIKLKDELFSNTLEIIIIDQNKKTLDIKSQLLELPEFKEEKIKFFKHCKNCEDDTPFQVFKDSLPIYQIVGLSPSTTIAKNYGIKKSSGEVIIFFDDDIEAHKDVINSHMRFQKTTSQIGILGGREVVYPLEISKRSFLKTKLAHLANNILTSKEEKKYKLGQKYVGRIHPKSFFFCEFNVQADHLIPVNTIRGCNASCRRVVFDKVNGFDENFQGSALREESDFSLRIEKQGFKNFYYGRASVTHHRQLGGCNNLSQSIQSFLSKMDNELYFQQKHFSHIPKFYFFLRLFPFAIDNLKNTFGLSILILLRYSFNLKKT